MNIVLVIIPAIPLGCVSVYDDSLWILNQLAVTKPDYDHFSGRCCFGIQYHGHYRQQISILLSLLKGDSAKGLLSSNYDRLPAEDKQDQLWQKIARDPYRENELPTANPSFFSLLNLFFPPFLKKSFTHDGDEMPNTRQKLIHTYGSVAKMEFRTNPNITTSFTGLLRSGAIGFVRLSLARQSEDTFIPGMGVKFLIDGKPSLNMHVMNSLEGQGGNKNFFERTFRNIIPAPSSMKLKLLSKAFAVAIWFLPGGRDDRPESETNLPLYEHAAVDNEGRAVSPVVAPYEISFTPNPELAWSPDTTEDLRVNLGKIPVGSVLYTVTAKRGLRMEAETIGEIISTSRFVASRYGDEILFFQHARHRWQSS
ncbi:uncharacterized protein LOC129599543 isoform X2 [Paramacrobiotus metropolitanus]|uniref:uncharacterized protein LOC129599543 isoform X2 n=1 Tax=Paramacrobiotus metropolitanus TaxID=2943436 RepID=UPI00244655C7|nr:uncharacterized protein LOC129599543 isoform X2 [Paramacrobiotus metropolitanus]